MWAQRCMMEAGLHDKNILVTLTYEVTDGKLHKDDLQKFLKRLRKHISPQKFRYYGCGEYGSKHNRPHYHLIIFGYCPDDLKLIFSKGEMNTYGSETIEKVWRSNEKTWSNGRKGGFISITEVNFRSARYCCKYLQKLDERYHEVMPFTVMSRKPGIGADAVNVSMLEDGLMYIEGRAIPIPKYYLDKLEQQGYNVDMIRLRRQYVAQHKGERLKLEDYYDCAEIDRIRAEGRMKEKELKTMNGV